MARLDGVLITATAGPLSWVQETDETVAPPFPVAVPVSVTELDGRVMVCVEPAFTVGGIFAGFTVMVTVALLDKPLLSVAASWNV